MTENPADWVIVVGDVNSTLACSIVAKKLHVNVAHVEAGLRSGDRKMPEEINRLVTDGISDLFFVTEPAGEAHLLREGHDPKRIHHVGHVMIDNLLFQAERLAHVDPGLLEGDPLKRSLLGWPGALRRRHAPSAVERRRARGAAQCHVGARASLCRAAAGVSRPSADAQPARAERDRRARTACTCCPPLPYMAFLNLWKDAAVVLTDSGGIQEETTGLGVPCVTVRDSTERPITIDEGSNVLAGLDPGRIAQLAIAAARSKQAPRRPRLWDGHAADRIAAVLARWGRASS